MIQVLQSRWATRRPCRAQLIMQALLLLSWVLSRARARIRGHQVTVVGAGKAKEPRYRRDIRPITELEHKLR